jgi:hypothetical protein
MVKRLPSMASTLLLLARMSTGETALGQPDLPTNLP